MFIIIQNVEARVEFIAPNFLLVYIYYCTECLSSRYAPRQFFLIVYVYIVLQNHGFGVEFFAQFFLLVYPCYFKIR